MARQMANGKLLPQVYLRNHGRGHLSVHRYKAEKFSIGARAGTRSAIPRPLQRRIVDEHIAIIYPDTGGRHEASCNSSQSKQSKSAFLEGEGTPELLPLPVLRLLCGYGCTALAIGQATGAEFLDYRVTLRGPRDWTTGVDSLASSVLRALCSASLLVGTTKPNSGLRTTRETRRVSPR